jgi:hypothetical protein
LVSNAGDLITKVLPIGVLQPGGNDSFITGVIGVLQVQQSGNQVAGQCRAATLGCEVQAKPGVDAVPIDESFQSDICLYLSIG